MCDHCGCRALTPIAALMDEHDAICALSDGVRRALASGDVTHAARELGRLAAVLAPHVRWEERGLFAELRAADEFVDHVETLEAEHAALDAAVGHPGGDNRSWADGARALLDALDAHIYKENFGLFPGALAALDDEAWQRIEDARPTEPATAGGEPRAR